MARSLVSRTEEVSHRAIVEFLWLALSDDVFFFHCPTGGARTKAEAGIFKALGVRPGIPDLLLLRHGQLYAIELKSSKGKLSSAQEECHRRMRQAGSAIAVARSVEDVAAVLTRWGFPLRVRVTA